MRRSGKGISVMLILAGVLVCLLGMRMAFPLVRDVMVLVGGFLLLFGCMDGYYKGKRR